MANINIARHLVGASVCLIKISFIVMLSFFDSLPELRSGVLNNVLPSEK